MNKKELKIKIEDFKEKLTETEKAAAMVKGRLHIERKQTPADLKELEKKYHQASSELERIQDEINRKKSDANNLKSRISVKKQEIEKSPPDKRLENWARISEEIKKMSEQIMECESTISVLEMQKFEAENAKEMAVVSSKAFEEKAHEKPIEEDPRLQAVIKEKDDICLNLNDLEAELLKLNRKSIIFWILLFVKWIYSKVKSWFSDK